MERLKNNIGFSLIEAAIAIAVLALVIGGIVAVFAAGAKASRKTQQQAAAYSLARGVLEQYFNWVNLETLGGGSITNGTYTNPPYPATLNNITYTPTLIISDGPSGAGSSYWLRMLNLTINWTDGAAARTISVSTLKSKYYEIP